MWKNSLNNSGFLIRNHGSQKEVTQYFSSAESKELPTQNPKPRENTLQEGREIKTFTDEGKLRDCHQLKNG